MDAQTPREALADRPTYTVGAALNTARILRYLGSMGEPVRLTRIAGDLSLHASTCLNILRTLADEGLVHHQPAAKTYSLGLGVIDLAQRALRQGQDIDLIRPMLERVARKHAVTVNLFRPVGNDHLVLVTHAVSASTLSVRAEI